MGTDRAEIQRFSLAERIIHWLVAIAFVYLMLTGLALFTPHLFWLAYVLGGPTTIRIWHPILGVIYALVLLRMFLMWLRDMKIDAEDKAWMKDINKYIRNEDEGLAEAGRFNAGQKLLFWLQVIAGALLLLSGIPLWFPESFGALLRQISILVHEIAALAVIGGIIVHIYMGTAVVRGSLRAMISGKVTTAWAKLHHPRWYRQVTSK
jgi:formate dehydrogenase subunit gamma